MSKSFAIPALSETRYDDKESYIVRLDVRTKMAISLAASVVIILLNTIPALSFLLLASTFYVLGLRRTKVLVVCYVAVILMWLFSIGFSYALRISLMKMPELNPATIMIPFMRMLIMVNVILTLALSSRIQRLLSALKSLRLPVWLYIPCVVMIRFIPTFIKDIRQIHEAMRTRGYSLNFFFFLRHPIMTTRLLIVPILFSALRSADELSVAAELKGIRVDGGMSAYKSQTFGKLDFIVLAAALACIGLAIFLHKLPGIYHVNGMF